MRLSRRLSNLSASVRQQISRLFLRNLGAFLLLDALLLFLGGLPRYWPVILAAEAALLALSLKRNTDLMRRVLTPLQALEETADVLEADQVDTNALRGLAARLDEINVSSLKTSRIQLSDGDETLSALTGAINSMLERIDRGYQAQARFVSDASHELRTPISVIQGYANMLDRWGKDDPEVRQEAINAIRAEAASMGSLVEQLLFLARGDNNTQAVEKRCFDLSELACAVFRETVLLETGRSINAEIPPGVPCWGDPGLVKQALRILVDNSVKYTPEGGQITLRLTEEKDYLALSVSDTGPGIAPEDLPRIFERFYRADQSRARETGGTGLGLPIARWIAARHGGSVQVSSVVGIGSRFTLLLPDARTSGPRPDAPETARTGKE